MKLDFGLTASDYAKHRAGFPDSLFDRLLAYGIGVGGQVIVDLSTGTGALARGFACRGCRVTGIDPSESMLAAARQLDADLDLQTDYRVGRAEATGLGDASADVVSAGQCWHWFDRAAAAELRTTHRARTRLPSFLLLPLLFQGGGRGEVDSAPELRRRSSREFRR